MAVRTEGLVLLAAVVLPTACRVGPKYHRPPVNAPAVFRGDMDSTHRESLGDERWMAVFRDEQLQRLISRALIQNYDVNIAAARLLQARAQLTITRADQFPTVTAEATATQQRTPQQQFGNATVPAVTLSTYRVAANLSWELDFWGKFRSATEAQRAILLGARWATRAVMVSVIHDVAQGYFTLRELDLQLSIARRTLGAREESLRLTRLQEQIGTVSMLDVRQAEQLVYTAASVITDTERLIEQQENAISTLLGENPHAIPRGLSLADQPTPPEVPAGLPSRLLDRRPDIRQAEQTLVAANARIGVAKAALFPQITLTADAGFQSNALSRLLSAPAAFWSIGGDVLQQVFNAGRLKANVALTEAQKLEFLYTYRKTIHQAFQEVSDALVGYEKTRVFRRQLTELVNSTGEAARLSDLRYRGGVASYLEVLTSQTSYFNAELNLAQARLNELLALVDLYSALGGGWQE